MTRNCASTRSAIVWLVSGSMEWCLVDSPNDQELRVYEVRDRLVGVWVHGVVPGAGKLQEPQRLRLGAGVAQDRVWRSKGRSFQGLHTGMW